jgi:putative drug exporter of the RND superfamily
VPAAHPRLFIGEFGDGSSNAAISKRIQSDFQRAELTSLPLFLFVILFGLSMDHHVLIISRVRESHEAGLDTREAVAHGIRATASVVTSAALVMVAVFAIFATLGMIDFKMMGVGLAVAVFVDATVVGAVLLPATMAVLGECNWYLPRWLGWLPRVGREEPAEVSAPRTRAHV